MRCGRTSESHKPSNLSSSQSTQRGLKKKKIVPKEVIAKCVSNFLNLDTRHHSISISIKSKLDEMHLHFHSIIQCVDSFENKIFEKNYCKIESEEQYSSHRTTQITTTDLNLTLIFYAFVYHRKNAKRGGKRTEEEGKIQQIKR